MVKQLLSSSSLQPPPALPPPALCDPSHQKDMVAVETYPRVKGRSQVRTCLPGESKPVGHWGRRLLIDTEKVTSYGEVAKYSFVCQVAPESKLPAGLKEELI